MTLPEGVTTGASSAFAFDFRVPLLFPLDNKLLSLQIAFILRTESEERLEFLFFRDFRRDFPFRRSTFFCRVEKEVSSRSSLGISSSPDGSESEPAESLDVETSSVLSRVLIVSELPWAS